MSQPAKNAATRGSDVLDHLPAARPPLQLYGLTHPSCQKRTLHSPAQALQLAANHLSAGLQPSTPALDLKMAQPIAVEAALLYPRLSNSAKAPFQETRIR